MRKKLLLPAMWVAAATVTASYGQTAPATTAPATPVQNGTTAPTSVNPPSQPPDASPTIPTSTKPGPGGLPFAPAPTPLTGPVPSRPGYQGQSMQVQTTPQPVPAPAPAVPPTTGPYTAMPPYLQGYIPYGIPDEDKKKTAYGSSYIPLDSWVYPAMLRLYSLDFVPTMFLAMRPYTRQSVMHMLAESEDAIRNSDSNEAKDILVAVQREISGELVSDTQDRGLVYGTQSVYTRAMGITGLPLRDSYHLGQTLNNDYGRPYANGFNLLTGVSGLAEYGRFSLHVRGEYQHAPGFVGYNQTLVNQLDALDQITPVGGPNANQATIPAGNVPAANPFRLVEATLSFYVAGHEISGGKTDAWVGPGRGGGLAWSNNAENIYSFRINRVEPLYIPLVSKLLGPFRYDFFYGSLKGHTDPNSPYVHAETFSFAPTKNVQIGFERTVIFGGEGHTPVTIHTFLKSFFDINDTTVAEKYSRSDPGARYSAFNFSWRLPFVRNFATLYTDSIAHDDVTPPSAPRRAAYRVGLYLSQLPGARRFDLRAEAVNTDPPVLRSDAGEFNYFETVQKQGYTNKGYIMGDWIGREAKGGQAWLTYHLSGNEWVELEYLNKKNTKDFIGIFNAATNRYDLGGTTQNEFKLSVLKRFHHDDVELNAWIQYERWKAPIYVTGPQTDTTTAVQLTFFPKLKTKRF